jgi:RNA polymerase-binding transcription factor DksA
MYPLNFFEFLDALGHEKMGDFLTEHSTFEPLPNPMHEKCLKLLKLYFFIGGMPEAVAEYAKNEKLNIVREIQHEILNAYEKDFALSLLSQEQDALYEIESALKRIQAHVYGVCEMSGQPIPVARLEAIPFARFTVECQTRFEQENKGKNRWEPAQPLMDSNETSDEESGEESDEEEKVKSKE